MNNKNHHQNNVYGPYDIADFRTMQMLKDSLKYMGTKPDKFSLAIKRERSILSDYMSRLAA